MRKPPSSSNTLRLALLIGLSGIVSACASTRPVPGECPKFIPSQEALRQIQGTGWKPLAGRVIETYQAPSSTPSK